MFNNITNCTLFPVPGKLSPGQVDPRAQLSGADFPRPNLPRTVLDIWIVRTIQRHSMIGIVQVHLDVPLPVFSSYFTNYSSILKTPRACTCMYYWWGHVCQYGKPQKMFDLGSTFSCYQTTPDCKFIPGQGTFIEVSLSPLSRPNLHIGLIESTDLGKDTELNLDTVITLMISTLNSELLHFIQEYRINAHQRDNQPICNS